MAGLQKQYQDALKDVSKAQDRLRALGYDPSQAGAVELAGLADDLAVMDTPDTELVEAIEERLSKRSPNYAVSLGAERDERIRDIWMAFRNGPIDEPRARELRERIVDAGVLIEGRRHLAEQTWRARRALNGLSPSPDRDALDNLVANIAK